MHKLSTEKICLCAIKLLDQCGLESLSMRNLASMLGVEAMSLYNHIKNKEELLDQVVDYLIRFFKVPKKTKNWKEGIRKRALSVRKVLRKHPWITMFLISRMNIGPNMLRYFDSSLGILIRAGFSFTEADHIVNVVDSHIYGFTLQELNFPIKSNDYIQSAKFFLPSLPADKYPYLRKLTEEVISKRYNGLHNFEFGLNLILEGIEKERT
ncbi:MAG: TetR/AcrR family transcriptional regulator [Leptospira sp.]|nr:TetR/AcrR family transcriptional regulator [Leptospira sp.]